MIYKNSYLHTRMKLKKNTGPLQLKRKSLIEVPLCFIYETRSYFSTFLFMFFLQLQRNLPEIEDYEILKCSIKFMRCTCYVEAHIAIAFMTFYVTGYILTLFMVRLSDVTETKGIQLFTIPFNSLIPV